MGIRFAGIRLPSRARQRGFAHIPILIAIGLAAATTAAFFNSGSGQNATAMVDRGYGEQVASNAAAIRQRMSLCFVRHGDHGASYPTPTGGSLVDVSTATCDTNSGSKQLWQGVDGYFIPEPPRGWSDWQYFNDEGGSGNIFIQLQRPDDDRADVAIDRALVRYSADEAERVPDSDTHVNAGNVAFRLYIRKP